MSKTKKLQVFGSLVGPPGPAPVKGKDYFTEADKAELVERVLEEMPEIDGNVLTEITYAELKALRDNARLKIWQFYRITDYVTTTVQANTQSAGHPFDIIVRALSERALDEEAKAVQHDGDEYFANNNLGGWQLRYTLDNNTSMFAWADEANGKGVVFRMTDEFGNECPYDFKNIQMLDANDPENSTYYYTFDAKGADHSLDGSQCFSNVINKNVVGAQQININW